VKQVASIHHLSKWKSCDAFPEVEEDNTDEEGCSLQTVERAVESGPCSESSLKTMFFDFERRLTTEILVAPKALMPYVMTQTTSKSTCQLLNHIHEQ
jgi:hypothetical protein